MSDDNVAYLRPQVQPEQPRPGALRHSVLERLGSLGAHGVTSKELARAFDVHHGKASSALAHLHRDGKITRLGITRARCKVYVLPDHVEGRATEEVGRNRRTKMLEQAVAVLRRVPPCAHSGSLDDCVSCDARALVSEYERGR